MFWNKKKHQTNIVWRDKTGKLACPGDSCPKECDDSCPIWLNSCGLIAIQMEDLQGAIRAFNKAFDLAPDFVDALNNLGTAYGMNNQHKEAYESFKKALSLNAKYANALTGLIVSEKNLGMYDDALRHCDMFEQMGADVTQLRKAIQIAKGDVNAELTPSYMDITATLLAEGRQAGYIKSDDFAHIPEILVQAEDVCSDIIVTITNYGEENPADVSNPSSLVLLWSAFAGMGAVYHWHTDWDNLSKTSIFEALTKERGLFAMDEYVYDAIGIGFGSLEERRLTCFLQELIWCCMAVMGNSSTTVDSFMSCAKAMFCFGMTFEMNRLGMF